VSVKEIHFTYVSRVLKVLTGLFDSYHIVQSYAISHNINNSLCNMTLEAIVSISYSQMIAERYTPNFAVWCSLQSDIVIAERNFLCIIRHFIRRFEFSERFSTFFILQCTQTFYFTITFCLFCHELITKGLSMTKIRRHIIKFQHLQYIFLSEDAKNFGKKQCNFNGISWM